MALQPNARTKILAGVIVLAAAGGGAVWFFMDDIMAMIDPPPPPKVAAKAPARPAAPAATEAAKAADPAKAAEAAKAVAEAPKAAADAVKMAEAGKPAAAAPAAKPAAKPIPTNPDQLIAEIIEISGLKAQIQNFGREVGRSASAANQQKMSDAEARQLYEITARILEPTQMTAEIHGTLKAAFDADRMTRFLEALRQPIAVKMAAQEARVTPPDETARLLEDIRKNPPTAQRQKLVQALDDITQSSETGVQVATLTAREVMDAMFSELQKAGKQVPKQARQFAGSRIVAAQDSMRSGFRTMYYITYRDASDEELGEYVKLLDTDTGRWGLQLLAAAQRAAVESRVRGFAKEVAQVAVRSALAKGKEAVPVAAQEEEKPVEKLATAAPAAPAAAAEPPAYKRAANTRELYTRYNDLITAAVMRDRVAVKELLDDGKYPDLRQKDGTTPLMIAAANGDAETASLLLAKGADPNLRAAGGRSALSLAKNRGAADVVRLLESRGAKD